MRLLLISVVLVCGFVYRADAANFECVTEAIIDTFEIKKIVRRHRCYIIYATSNGKTYKLISGRKKEKSHVSRDNYIKKGHSY